MLTNSTQLTPEARNAARLKADAIIEAQKKIGIDAANIGYKDLSLGLEYLEKKESDGFPYVSANLCAANGAKTNVPAYRILKANGIKVGIFGLVDDKDKPAGNNLNLDYSVTDPFNAAEKTVKELKEKGADVVVLLSGMTLMRNKELANRVKGINFIISGGDVRMLGTPEKEGETIILAAMNRGKYVGVLHVGYFAGSLHFRMENEERDIRSRIAVLESQKRVFEGQAASMPDVKLKLDQINNEEKEIQARLAELGQTSSVIKNRMVSLEPSIAGREDIVKILQKINKKVGPAGH